MRRILAAGLGILVIAVPAIAASAFLQDRDAIDANGANASEDERVVQNDADGCETGQMTLDEYRTRCADGIYGNAATWNTAPAHDEAGPNMAHEAPPAEPEQ